MVSKLNFIDIIEILFKVDNYTPMGKVDLDQLHIGVAALKLG